MGKPIIDMHESVATVKDLPLTGNAVNDARFVEDACVLYAWDGQAWEQYPKPGACPHCNERFGTEKVVDFGYSEERAWCEQCVVELKLAHAYERASEITKLETRLKELSGRESHGMKRVNIRQITVGNVHSAPGDPDKVTRMCQWLKTADASADLPPLIVREKPNGTYRIWDGRHRFLAYVLAERETVPVVIAKPEAT